MNTLTHLPCIIDRGPVTEVIFFLFKMQVEDHLIFIMDNFPEEHKKFKFER